MIFFTDGTDKGRIFSHIILIPVHGRVKIGLDFEELRKIGVLGIEDLVDNRGTDQDDFQVEGYGFRLDAFRGDISSFFNSI